MSLCYCDALHIFTVSDISPLSFHLQLKRHFGGGIMGDKTNARLARLAKIKAREAAAKAGGK